MWQLPESLTDEVMREWLWRPTPVFGYELCEQGLLRRPLDYNVKGTKAGMLYGSRLNTRGIGYYALVPKGSYGSTCVRYKPEELMTEVFGAFRNRNLNVYTYCVRLNALIQAYNAHTFKLPADRRNMAHREEAGMSKLRKCHDCGRKTRNYRCDACWRVVLSRTTSCDHPDDEYKAVWSNS